MSRKGTIFFLFFCGVSWVLELPIVGFMLLCVVFVWTLVLSFFLLLFPCRVLFIYLFGFRGFILLTYVHIPYAFGPNEVLMWFPIAPPPLLSCNLD
jgi:hypothetical protein